MRCARSVILRAGALKSGDMGVLHVRLSVKEAALECGLIHVASNKTRITMSVCQLHSSGET